IGMVAGTHNRFAWLDFVPPETGGADDGWSLGPVEGRGSMPWRPDSEVFSSTWAAYYAEMERLVAILMRLFALALGLEAETFKDALVGHRSSMRAILYAEVSQAELSIAGGEVVRSPEHTDWGCVTVLLPDPNVGGLEVCGKDGTWKLIQPPPDGLVVNLGELLKWWTRGAWVATPHRVLARSGCCSQRLSVPYFGLVNRSTVLAPLVQGQEPGERHKAPAVFTAGEFFDHHEEYSRPMQESS
ncbi:unnamed protein product, partial [Polarella glacialis]